MLNVRSFLRINIVSRVPSSLFIRKLASKTTATQFSSVLPEPKIISDEDFNKLKRTFSSPRNIISNYFKNAERTLDLQTGFHFSFTKKKGIWNCQLSIQWPSPIVFSSAAATKTKAAETVSLRAIQWLQEMDKLDSKGKPILVSQKQRIDVAHSPVTSIDLDEKDVKLITNLFQKYNQEILPVIKKEIEEIDVNELTEEPSFVLPKFSHSDYVTRNQKLFKKSKQLPAEVVKLPIDDYKETILDMVQKNRVTIIKGEPGCGKSTRVPNFIIDQWSRENKGGECNIYVTQPRRISAITLAQRVAEERLESLGDVVGYQVRLSQVLPKTPGSVVFASSGILLQKLQLDPGLKEFSHVIIDEAHEQDINTEILLMLTKNALELNTNLKLIIMSATLDAQHFQKYFGRFAESISIPGATYPVKTHFLSNQLFKELGISNNDSVVEQNGQPFWNPFLVAKVIKWIDAKKPSGAILCFVSGWQDIMDISKMLQKGYSNNLDIKFAHSKLTPEKQIEIMQPGRDGKRKVVLATNIAETSITINDIVYVIDTGMQNVSSWSAEKGMKYLDRGWVSQANARQRRGRAGRTRPGECYHLYTSERYNKCTEYPVPEIHSTPLEHTILNLKIHSDKKARLVLSKLLNPPDLENINGAVSELKLLGALDNDEVLTALGKRIAAFPFDPFLSKALVNSIFFKCLDPTLTIITYLSSNVNIFKDVSAVDSRMIKNKYSPNSDHLAVAKMFSEWNQIQREDRRESTDFCRKNYLSEASLVLMSRLRNLFAQHLFNSMLIDDKNLDNLNVLSEMSKDELLPAVLISGFGNLVFKRLFMRPNGRKSSTYVTDGGIKVIMHSESVNYNRSNENDLLTYYREGRTLDNDMAMLNKTTSVHPIIAVLFFTGQATFKHDGQNNCIIYVKNKKRINISCSKGDWQNLTALRQVIWNLVDYMMKTYGHNEIMDETDETILNFRDLLCSVLCKLVEKKN
ncbi:ATP-dependent RNA helicase DHX30-like isoform X2 [Adelges cooleyi]|uniref:ATP-dependent RNA helicase DHX30-like isoform X2 n=1 Tax=Adelges cooleyi TaxID=133065 RepID=UPI00217FA4E2|nr:ATP-dependent RNA helicase DHX30-like isoform X2 [Adelges cooleyi]